VSGKGESVADVDVVVVGAGPVGLLLAGELSLHGVVPLVLERLAERSPVPKPTVWSEMWCGGWTIGACTSG
jgi:2-polyprenyl-6-methoxyphenol hydroxylase-like FAD-dependent oxidoreductase